MMVVLEKARAGSQKKTEFAQSFIGTANYDISGQQTHPVNALHSKMLQ